MPLEFENYLQPCGVSNFYAAMASTGSMSFNDVEIAVKNKNTFNRPTSNDDAQPHLTNGTVIHNHLTPNNDGKKMSDPGPNGLRNSDVFLLSNGTLDVGQSGASPSELDDIATRGRTLKQRKLGRTEHNFNESLLNVFVGNQSKFGTDSASTTDHATSSTKTDTTSGFGRPLTPAMRQHSLPARMTSARKDSDVPESTPRRRHHSVKFADELGKLLSTCVLIPSRYEDTERATVNGAPQLLDDSDDSNLEVFFTSSSKRGGSGGCNTLIASRNEFNRVKRSGDLSQSQLPFHLCFDPPMADYDLFLSKLQSLNICLEKVKLELVDVRDQTTTDLKSSTAEQPALREMAQCVVRVANISFHKRVFARYTSDDWQTSTDLDTTYVDPGTGGFSVSYDTFVFSLAKPPGSGCSVSPSGRPGEAASRSGGAIEFSLCFEANGVSHWDNNSGRNYRIVWF